ncbi:MAG: hypothetical protein EA379_10740 [Phycisphaerales bacterium]|nr:MAG: hypothetical protein EA379_10740 [Phycisphaerales bacterium]
MHRPPVRLCRDARRAVDGAIRGLCHHRGWILHALHVRTNHVHLVISAPAPPERVMNAAKTWSTRQLVANGIARRGTRNWSRHGSTRWLHTETSVSQACRYTLESQGEPFGSDAVAWATDRGMTRDPRSDRDVRR